MKKLFFDLGFNCAFFILISEFLWRDTDMPKDELR